MSFSMGCGRFLGPIILTEVQAYSNWVKEHVEGATFAKQTEPRPNTTDNYMCIGTFLYLELQMGVFNVQKTSF